MKKKNKPCIEQVRKNISYYHYHYRYYCFLSFSSLYSRLIGINHNPENQAEECGLFTRRKGKSTPSGNWIDRHPGMCKMLFYQTCVMPSEVHSHAVSHILSSQSIIKPCLVIALFFHAALQLTPAYLGTEDTSPPWRFSPRLHSASQH